MKVEQVRVWYSTGNKAWFVDCGPGTAQRLTNKVIIHADGETMLNGDRSWPDGPYGWLSFRDVNVYFANNYVYIGERSSE